MNQEKELSQEEVWDRIAEPWNNFRQKPHKDVLEEIEKVLIDWKKGKILDIGCGNCRNLILFKSSKLKCYGIDFSKSMIENSKIFCRKNNFDVNLEKGYAEKINFKCESFDYVLCLNVLHCIETEKREIAIKEIYRVLKQNGEGVISVWNKLQKRFLFSQKESTVPWKKDGTVYQRYYYLFTPWEFKKFLRKAGFEVLSCNFFGKNIIARVKKK